MTLQASGRSYIYTRYPIKLKNGKVYKIEVQLKNPTEYISYYVNGITPKVLPLTQEDNKYVAELEVDKEPNENGNQFRIYVESDCVIESILVKEIE